MQQEIIWRIATTVLVIISLWVVRHFTMKYVANIDFSNSEARRRALITVRNVFIALVIISISIIWLSHIRNLAISLAAIAVACVIATKEVILCVMGSIMHSITQPFKLSDRIEINNVRGDVIDMGLTSTTLLEIGTSHQYTGRAVIIPNSMFFSFPVVNETYLEEYILHVFHIPFERNSDWETSEKLLLEAAKEICGEYLEEARLHMDEVNRESGLEVPSVEPRTTVQVTDTSTIEIYIRIPVPSRRKGRIEQAILRLYFDKEKEFKASSSDEGKQA